MEEKRYCPECGAELEFNYEREDGTKVYYCPEGDEDYYFEEEDGYEYAVCLYDGKRICVGVAGSNC